MKTPLVLISSAFFGIGVGPATSQESEVPSSIFFEDTSTVIATPEQETEIRKLIEDFVITEKEAKTRAAEQLRFEKARADAEKDKSQNSGPFPPVAADDTPPETLKELGEYSKTRREAYRRLVTFKSLAFPMLAAHLDDERPSMMHWNHVFVKTVRGMCYRVIHDQLMTFPDGYTEYGLNRLGRDGKQHQKPYWASTPYDESGGLAKWLQQNHGLTYIEKRIKCLTWLLEGERKIGVIDPRGYYINIVPLELEILKLKAAAGQDVTNELGRIRELWKSRPGDQIPKELLPDGPLPEIEEKHALQETSAVLKSCPDGHTTLKDVPIRYGHFPMLTKKPEDWNDEDKALAKRWDAKEFIVGGEIDSAEDPRFQPTCLTCGYSYKMLAVPEIGANWVKTGHKLSDFATQLSPVTTSLPFAGRADADISVEVTKERLVVSETIEVTLPASQKNELVTAIEKWIDENHFKRSLLHVETPALPRLDEQTIEDHKARFYIEVHTNSGKETTHIGFSLERSDN